MSFVSSGYSFSSRPARVSRRRFCATLGAAAVALPFIVPSGLRASTAANSRLRIGQIGFGRIARDNDCPGALATGLGEIVAVCDVDQIRLKQGVEFLTQRQSQDGRTPPAITAYGDFREMLARENLDAVIISTPDHWHAEPALLAARAGKAIYLQKPFTMTHAEGIRLRDEVVRTGVCLQVGSQQRANSPWPQFRRAAELVRSGRLGKITRVEIGLPIDPTKPDEPEQPIPANLDYDRWLGCTPQAYYTEQRVHPQNGITRPGWLRSDAHCLGMITGWGSHHYDIMHWALDLENTGPSRVEGRGEFPDPSRIWNVHGGYEVNLTYPGDIAVNVSNRFDNGIKFFGDDGWIFVARDGAATASDPTAPSAAKPLRASKDSLLDPAGLAVRLPVTKDHYHNWLECAQTKATPLAHAVIAHRSNTSCIVSWIAMKLARPLTWDPVAERFINDPEANALLTRSERAPYGILHLA
jgi:predicted dehydrogenase